MRFLPLALSLLLGSPLAISAAAAPELKPGAILEFHFPELSENLATWFENQPVPNVLVAELPANYTPEGRFPIITYIDGGTGGIYLRTKRLREAVGPNDYICLRLPLFKAAKIPTDPAGGKAVLSKDFDVIRKNYRVMLQRLFDAVPNITRERSIFGGFSNGAHTTAVLLEGRDDFLLEHFTHFYFAEGGIRQLTADTLSNPALRDAHFLVLIGDRGRGNPFEGEGFAGKFAAVAKSSGLDFTLLPMRGYGHELPLDYLKLLRPWAAGEPLVLPPPKAAPPENTQAAEPASTPRQ